MFQAIKNLISRRHGLRLALPLIASVLVHWGTVRAQTTACTTDAVDKEKVADTMRQMYVAATNDDMVLFHRVAATDFYAFDGGHRFTGDALMDLIQSAHKAGKHYVWTVNEHRSLSHATMPGSLISIEVLCRTSPERKT